MFSFFNKKPKEDIDPIVQALFGVPTMDDIPMSPLNETLLGQQMQKELPPSKMIGEVSPIEEDILESNKQIVQDEGEIGHIYLDIFNKPHFGVGSLLSSHINILLDAGFTKNQIDSHVKKLQEAKSRGELPKLAQNYPEEFQLKIPRNVYSKAFKQGLDDASIVFNKYTEGLELPKEAAPVIKNLAYQLGPKLYEFTKLNEALKNKDYNKAADEILYNTVTQEKSKLYKQTPSRTQRRADEIRRLAK
tara:strand:- start:41 stop:781 length:741 start_codon:yes stop_codon:yes gene_type:complete